MHYSAVNTVRSFSLLKTAAAIATSSALAAVAIVGFGAVVDLDTDSTSVSRLRNSAPDFSSQSAVTGFPVSLIEALEVVDAYTVIVHSDSQAPLPAPAFVNGNGNLLIDNASTAHGSKITFGEKHGLVAGVTVAVTSLSGDYFTEVIGNPNQ